MAQIPLTSLDDSDLDEYYYAAKDYIIGDVLKPVIDISLFNHIVHIYNPRDLKDLMKENNKDNWLKEKTLLYNEMVRQKQALLVKLNRNDDVKAIQKQGYFPDTILIAFKDELLNTQQKQLPQLNILDPEAFLQEQWN